MAYWKTVALAIGLAAAPALALAQTGPGMPDFAALEQQYRQDPSLALSRGALARAIPAGTPLEQARAALVDVGAACKPTPRQPDGTRCLIHQFTFVDRSADDIRWTISLTAPGGAVRDVAVSRYVDRHLTN